MSGVPTPPHSEHASPYASAWLPDDVDVAILGQLATGETVEVVARGVGLSERTVRRRLRSLADDLGVDSTIETVVHAVRVGLI